MSANAKRLLGLALAALTFAGFARTLGNRLVFDDRKYLTENPHLQDGLTPEAVRWAFTTDYATNWHPLTWLSLQADYRVFRGREWGYHLTNVLLHAANVVLLFWSLQVMTGAVWRSALVAALFAVHPLHVESVAWVSERKDVLSTFFGLLALLAYAGYASRPGWARYLLVALFFALSLLAKQMLVTLPCVFLLLDYWPLRRWGGARVGPNDGQPPAFAPARLGSLLLEKIPLIALAIAAGVMVFRAQSGGGSVLAFPLGWRVSNALVSYVAYIGKMYWPAGLAPFYPHPRGSLPAWEVAGAAVLLAAVTAGVVWAGGRFPYLPVGWFWYLGTLTPVIGLVLQVGEQAMADRYTYFPLIGLFLVGAWSLADAAADGQWTKEAAAAAAGLVGACLVLTWVQAGYWHDEIILWKHALAVTTNNAMAEGNLALALERAGQINGAAEHYQRALDIDPRFPKVKTHLGVCYALQGKRELAVKTLDEAVLEGPESAWDHYNLAVALEEVGRKDEARRHFERALELDSGFTLAADALARLKR